MLAAQGKRTMQSAQQIITHIETLASPPSVYIRMREELDSPESSITQVARIAATDSALTARLLKIVNSALYGYDRSIESVYRAITILGLQHVQDLVLALSISSAFQEIRMQQADMHKFWHDSLLRGLMARNLGQQRRLPAFERLFTIGLLADIGHLVLRQTSPELVEQARQRAETEDISLAEAEQQVIGCHYAEVGAALLERWKLPSSFPATIGAQINPRLGGKFAYEATVLHVAAHFVATENSDPEQAAACISPVIWSQLGIDAETAVRLYQEALQHLGNYFELFFPRLK